MKASLIVFSIVLFSIIGITLIGITEDPLTADIDYDKVAPSEKHKILADMKARRLDVARKLAQETNKTISLYDQTQFNVGFYSIDLNVDIVGETIGGDVMMQAVAEVDGIDTIEVDLFDILTIDSVYNSSGLLNYNHGGNKVIVELDQTYNTGESFQFNIVYSGTPPVTGFLGFNFDVNTYGDKVVSSLSEPYAARTWWPCKDRPDDKADSIDITITCDEPYFCASNGTLIDTVSNGDGTWTFNYQVRYPITTYLFSVAISEYSIWEDWYHYGVSDSMVIRHHVYPDRLAYSLGKYNITPDAIAIFAELFGEYPFLNEKYGHANFEWGGGMEHQTVTSMTGGTFGFSQDVVVHELAHQWWGDMITCENWHHIWLNEGFATYCEALYRESKGGFSDLQSYMNGIFYSYAGTIYVQDTTDAWSIFTTRVYDKGAWVLHMLRHVVGDSTFFDIMQTYYGSAHQHSHASTEDFQAICESVSGQELDYFFQEWIYGNYFPRFNWNYMTELDPSDGKYLTYLHMTQTQSSDPQVFSMPVDLVFTFAVMTDTVVQFVDSRDTIYIYKTDKALTNIELDPNDWILKQNSESAWTIQLLLLGLDTTDQYSSYVDSAVTRGGSGDNRFTINSGAMPNGLTLDSLTGIISGTPTESGDFSFEIRVEDVAGGGLPIDLLDYLLTVTSNPALPGDANADGAVNIIDLTYLITFIYSSGPAPNPMETGDPNHSCNINILDLTYLISYLYQSGPAPLWGCAS